MIPHVRCTGLASLGLPDRASRTNVNLQTAVLDKDGKAVVFDMDLHKCYKGPEQAFCTALSKQHKKG